VDECKPLAAGFVCECGVLNPVVAVEIKVTLGGYTSLTFGDTEKSAFRQGLLAIVKPTLRDGLRRFRAAIPAAAVTPATSEPSASEPSPAAVPSLPATSEPRPAVSLPAASLPTASLPVSRDTVLWKMSAEGTTLSAVGGGGYKEAPGFRPRPCERDASACIRGHQALTLAPVTYPATTR